MDPTVRTGAQPPTAATHPADAATAAPRANFPLPRELRDQIYSYLLWHKHVRAESYHTRPQQEQVKQSKGDLRNRSAAHTYRFHTDILAVNKDIHVEVEQELHRTNVFIIVSWVWPDLGSTLHAFDLPVVTEEQSVIARFEHYALRLHLRHSTPKAQLGPAAKVQSLLMLHSDLPILCRTLRYISATVPLLGSVVSKHRAAPNHQLRIFTTDAARCVHSQIKFGTNSRHIDSMEKQAQVLAPLERMCIPGQTITVLGVDDPMEKGIAGVDPVKQAISRLKILAAPKDLWISLVAWDMLDTALALMSAANMLVSSGDLVRAGERYKRIYADVLERSIICKLPEEVFESDAAPQIICFIRVLIDAVTAAGLLHLRNLDVQSAQEAANYAHGLISYISQFDSRNDVLGFEERGMWLIHAPFGHFYNLLQVAEGDHDLSSLREEFATLRDLLPANEYIAHDLDVISAMARRSQESGSYVVDDPEDLLRLSSAIALPPQTFLYEVPEHVVRPARVLGWVDLDQHEAHTFRKEATGKVSEILSPPV